MAKLDDLDLEILKRLEIDARVSYRQIAKDIMVSVGTVHNRIKKLKDLGVFKGVLLDLDIEKLGFGLQFLIMVNIDGKYTNEVLESISHKYDEITTIYRVLGEQSAVMMCRFKEKDDVQKFLQRLNEEPHVIKTVSNMILNTYKQDEHHLFGMRETPKDIAYSAMGPKEIDQNMD